MGDLIARLEAAESGSRELDALIADAFDPIPEQHDGFSGRWPFAPGSPFCTKTAPVTTSLDAALALAGRVLPGWAWSVNGPDRLMMGDKASAYAVLAAPETNGAVEPWAVDREVHEGSGNTGPLALCLAILKATPEKSNG